MIIGYHSTYLPRHIPLVHDKGGAIIVKLMMIDDKRGHHFTTSL
jgi:hypothetical protein